MSLNSSDIVAIIAVIVSAAASSISAYISYKNNRIGLDVAQQNLKANILAKRTEFIFEKQISVFREVSLKIDEIIVILLNGIEEEAINEEAEEKFFSALEKESDTLLWFFNGEDFYLPKKVSAAIQKFLATLKKFKDKRDYQNKWELIVELVPQKTQITNLMREYWGIDAE